MGATVLFWLLALLAVGGALSVLLTRDVMRLGLGLGAFLLALAGYFAAFGFGFLALAQIFLYVGGVLVLIVFAIMLIHRDQPGSPSLQSRHDPIAAVAAIGISVLLAAVLRPLVIDGPAAAPSGVDALGAELLGRMLPQFEVAGLLLLAALVAVVTLTGGDDE
ncbi:MAG: NADH-quinone oxidoreductase subunit J [Coriobacteriia bacterium]|nr:NADH-quinone oxidoreductase subunit J [Coriobacteriia bacterium]